MFKLLIVDDEYIVRRGLKTILPWEKINVIIAGEAGTVREAVEVIASVHPDIILCDICLPGGTGFDVVKTARNYIPWVQVIMLTAYSLREYMLDAIHYEVCDYLFKPVNLDDLQDAVKKACRKIERFHENEQEQLTFRNLMSENIDVLREKYINDLVHNKISLDTIRGNMDALNITLNGRYYQTVLIHGEGENEAIAVQTISSVFHSFRPVLGHLFEDPAVFILILNCDSKDSRMWEDILEKAGTVLYKSDICDFIPAIPENVLDNLKNVSHEEKIVREPQAVKDSRRHVFEALKYNDSADEVQRSFNEYLAETKKAAFSEKKVIESFRTLMEMISVLSDSPLKINYLQLKTNELQDEFDKACTQIRGKKNRYGGLTDKALYYIRRHYKEEFSLEQAAAELFTSASYLSRVIKEETGKGFQQWLQFYRLEQAQKLLQETDENVEQIAAECGYNSYRIFSENFKKEIGMTATQYRSICINSGDD